MAKPSGIQNGHERVSSAKQFSVLVIHAAAIDLQWIQFLHVPLVPHSV